MRHIDELRHALKTLQYRYHSHHPFDKLLQSGMASRDMLAMWAANRYYYQDTIPRKDAAIIAHCRDSSVRAAWLRHIQVHDVDGALSEWLQLTRALGMDDEDVKSGRWLLAGTRFACDAYYHFCRDNTWQDGACASMTHLFAGDMHTRRVNNWPTLYPWLPDTAFEYFRKRMSTLPGEIDCSLQLVAEHFTATPERLARAKEIVTFKQDVLWAMMDALWMHFFCSACHIPRNPVARQSDAPLIRMLGTGAGGGTPQWNATDVRNQRARHSIGTVRTQSSATISADRTHWTLINCSPDFRTQWNEHLRHYPQSIIDGVMITDCQLDHVAGLLSMREGGDPLHIYATKSQQSTLSKILSMLNGYKDVVWHTVTDGVQLTMSGVSAVPHVVCTHKPKYASTESDVVALRFEGDVVYAPTLPLIPDALNEIIRAAPIAFIDGTYADDDSALTKGHVSMQTVLDVVVQHRRLIFVHINHNNHRDDVVTAHDGEEYALSRSNKDTEAVSAQEHASCDIQK